MDSFEAISFGPEVASLLSSRSGHILATLSNALYLESYEGYVAAIVEGDAVDGPLSLRVRDLPLLLEALHQHAPLTFRSTVDTIDLDASVHLSLRHASAWTPILPDHIGEVAARYQAADALAGAIAEHSRDSTLAEHGSLVIADLVRHYHMANWDSSTRPGRPADLTVRRIADGIVRFADALSLGDTGTAAGALTSLIGLGPGLTPAGDDLVSGVMAMLIWRARLGALDSKIVEEIGVTINKAAERTNRISARLLYHACAGVLYVPAMQLGAALLAGTSSGVGEPTHRLFGVGHSSGTDLATGLLVGCLVTLSH